jgi:hypothetical protein
LGENGGNDTCSKCGALATRKKAKPKPSGSFQVFYPVPINKVPDEDDDEAVCATVFFRGKKVPYQLLRDAVGGSIETYPTENPQRWLVCNESGLVMGLPKNERASQMMGGMGGGRSTVPMSMYGTVVLIDRKYM